MSIDPQWIIAGASCISAFAIVAAAIQIKLSFESIVISKNNLENIAEQLNLGRKVYIDSHDSERRKKAISLLKDWTLFLADNGTAAKGFVAQLGKEQCKEILNEAEVIVDEKYKDYLERNIPKIGDIEKSEECREREVKLSRYQSSIIRQQSSSYLNLLETILSARRHGIADKAMIYEQFANLVIADTDRPIMHNFRRSIGGIDAFPSIHAFVEEVAESQSPEAGKDELGQC